MRFKKLKLTNIRSYTSATIEFPAGSVLLAGDIGSGKSSILHAIEFALFGIKASELPGSALLRHGKREGAVELTFDLAGKEIVVKRSLKRLKQGIVQDVGYLIMDGVKKDATPKELRALIFELLGYPKDLVSKNKDLIYRYTVYTPQEAMKDILYEKKEDRLDTLRKVFNMDKYKRIRENTLIVLQGLKEKRKELEGYTQDLEQKKKDKLTQQEQIILLKSKIEEKKPQVEAAKQKLQELLVVLQEQEKNLQVVQQKKREFQVLETQLQSLLTQRKRATEDLERVQKEIEQLNAELEGKTPGEDVREKIKGIQEAIQTQENKLRESYQLKQKAELTIEQQNKYKDNITSLGQCPTCEQEVTEDHKRSIGAKVEAVLVEQQKQLNTAAAAEKEITLSIKQSQEQLVLLQKQQQEQQILQLKFKNRDQKKADIERLSQLQESTKKDIGSVNVKKMELSQELKDVGILEKQYEEHKKTVDLARETDRKLELEFTSLTKEAEGIDKVLQTIDKDIVAKEAAVKELDETKSLFHWFSQFFMNLMSTIEKHVMVQINREFNELFKNWFSILMEDELISVRVDDEFTPIIEQNGYETPIMNLSGGEKTSVALSYRLSLNKVINDIVGEIKTKDVLMLDEPTDGFSTEQLDKIREVLDLLNIGQVLIVSHEAKIESFVDHVIRVGKADHTSVVGE